MARPASLSGFPEWLPSGQVVEQLVLDTARRVFELHGFAPLETRSVEPLEQLDPTFFNHAHNEYLETWLEAGWLGAGLIIAFLIWYGRRLWAAWKAGPSRERDLQRAASIALLAMLAHSGVDYPLRTATLAVLFALCAAILEKAGRPTDRELA